MDSPIDLSSPPAFDEASTMGRSRKPVAMFAWAFFFACLALAACMFMMNEQGSIDDEMFTIGLSFLSTTLTTVVIICGVFLTGRSNAERYEEIRSERERKDGPEQ